MPQNKINSKEKKTLTMLEETIVLDFLCDFTDVYWLNDENVLIPFI